MNLLDVESNKRLIEDNNALVSSYLQKKLPPFRQINDWSSDLKTLQSLLKLRWAFGRTFHRLETFYMRQTPSQYYY